MAITQIETITHEFGTPGQSPMLVFVTVRTDDGLVGHGES